MDYEGGYQDGPHQVGEQPLFYDDDSRLDQVVGETLRQSWIRFEYLNWNIQDPGRDLLGARMATLDPRQPFQAFDVGNIPRLGVSAAVPDLGNIQPDGLNGVRATIGVPTQLGTLEADVWGITQGSQSDRIRPTIDLNGLTIIPAISLLSNGSPSDSTMVLFDTDYRSQIQTSLFGTQGNFYFNPVSTGSPLLLKPLVGFRYVRFHEDLLIHGVDVATGTTPRIDSESGNNLFGPQIGLRLSHDNRWFSLGVEPKLMLGVNRHNDSVSAQDILNPGNRMSRDDNATDFAPVIDLSGYGKIHLSDNVSLFAGYQLLILTNITRPSDQIRYDSPLVTTDPPQIGLLRNRQSLVTHGFMVGGEFRFR